MPSFHNPFSPQLTMFPLMLSLMRRLRSATLPLLATLALAWGTTAHAGPGHDHGDAPASAAATALPRFAATSDGFELVGVLQGQHLSLYLDRAPDNSPVDSAQITLEINGTAVPVQAHATGEYEANLTQPLSEGDHAVAATIVAGTQSDLLAATLDLHGNEAAHAEPASVWRKALPWLAGLAALVAAAAMAWVSMQRTRRTTATGGAA